MQETVGERHPAPIRAEIDTVNDRIEAVMILDQLPVLNIPYLQGSIVTAAQKPISVRAEGKALDPIRVTRQQV